jgi:hypothetical protein
MKKKPDDRPKALDGDKAEIAPEVYIVVGGTKFPRPGLETYFAQFDPGKETPPDQRGCSCDPVAGVYCSCNKVTICGCKGHSASSRRGRSSGGGGCRCAPVH